MTKDRLIELQKIVRVSENSNNNENQTDSDAATKTKNFKKTFERSEIIKKWIEEVEDNVETIKKELKTVADIKQNQGDVRDKLESLFQSNTALSHQISGKLREFQGEVKGADQSGAQGRIAEVQYNTLKARFQEAFKNNTKQLENYKNIQKGHIRAHLIAKGNINVTEQELDNLIDEGRDIQVFTENIISETAEARRLLADIEDRHEQLIKIETMIREVHDLFLQMAFLVDTQVLMYLLQYVTKWAAILFVPYLNKPNNTFIDTINCIILLREQELIDRVEFQAARATEYVGSGVLDLESARRKKTTYRKRTIYCSIYIVVVILIVGLSIYLSWK